MVEYRVADDDNSAGPIMWAKLADGSFLVDPEYIDDFKTEYPDAVQVATIKE